MDRSLSSDDLAIYITTRNQSVISRALEGVINKLDVWAIEKKAVSMIFMKRDEYP